MRFGTAFLASFCATFLLAAAPLHAGWKLMPAGQQVTVAKGNMKVTPAQDWSRWSRRPSRNGEIWTIDGITFNELTFIAAVPSGRALYHDRQRRNRPLPKFKSDMLLSDLVELFESSSRILLQSSQFDVGETKPAKLAGYDAVRFEYSYAIQGEELRRKGEAVAAIIDKKLYVVNFVAPAIHYYDRDIGKIRKLIESIEIIK